MNKKEFEFKKRLIEENFMDNRSIKYTPELASKLDEDAYQGGDIFTTEDGEFIDLEFQKEDFDEMELAKYIGFAESLYEKHHKKVSIYILCPKNINIFVREHRILSDADFTIKIKCFTEDLLEMILDKIKRKIKNDEPLDSDDMTMVESLPVMCAKKDKYYYRVESLKIINRYFY